MQLKAHKQVVNDISIEVGRKQCIETLDGYVIPLNIQRGLPYMTIHPYTDTEWDNLPHVILTLDTNWHPAIINHGLEDGEERFVAMQGLPDIEPDPLFDDAGDYKHLHHVIEAMIESNI